MRTSSFWKIIITAIPLVLIFFVYCLGLPGGFFFDDYPNIVNSEFTKITSLDFDSITNLLKAGNAGPLGRPLPVLTFGLNHYFFGMSASAFKVVNILLHLINVVLLFIVLRILCSEFFSLLHSSIKPKPDYEINSSYNSVKFWIPLLGALIWAAHPINVSSVLYIVQRMTIMSATFSLLALILYCIGRISLKQTVDISSSTKMHGSFLKIKPYLLIILCLFCILLSALSKENGLLTIGVFFILEVFLFRFSFPSRNGKVFIYLFFTLFLLLPAIYLFAPYVFGNASLSNGYTSREFNFEERLFTQPRILMHYLKWIIMPNTYDLGFFHDDIPFSTSLFSPFTTFLSTFFIFIITPFIFLLARKKLFFIPIAIGLGWFFTTHFFESSIFALEMVFEHRNYFPSIGIIVLFLFLAMLYLHSSHFEKTKVSLIFLFLIFITFLSITAIRSDRWSNQIKRASAWAQNHPNSSRSNYELALAYSYAIGVKGFDPDFADEAIKYFLKSSEVDNKNQNGILALILFCSSNNLEVKKEWINNARLRLASHPVTPNVASQFNALYKCIYDRKCQSRKYFIDLITSSITNNKISTRTKGQLLSIRGSHYLTNLRKFNLAEKDFLAALEIDNNTIEYHLLLVRAYIAQGSYKKARSYIEWLLKQEKFYSYNKLIERELGKIP